MNSSHNFAFNVLGILFLFLLLLQANKSLCQFQNENHLIYQENDVLIFENATDKKNLGSNVYVDESDFYSKNKLFDCFDTFPQEVRVTEGHVIFSAVQSPFDDKWAYMERKLRADDWNLWIYDPGQNSYELIYTDKTCPVPDMALAPFGFRTKDELVMEANQLRLVADYQGIWSLNLNTKELASVNLKGNYIGTPIVSPDGKHLIYTATSDSVRDVLHSIYDEMWILETDTQTDRKLLDNKRFTLLGWTTLADSELNILSFDQKKSRGMSSNLSYKIPFPEGETYYVTRAGTPVPTGGPGNGSPGCFSTSGAHDAKRAHDWSNNQLVGGAFQEPFSSSTDGEVTFAGLGDPTGFGAFIIILMPDGNMCYYGHCTEWFVSDGDCVVQGQIIGTEGARGSSTGEHLHQEFRGPSGSASSSYYVTMDDCGGCIPYTGYCYTSGNEVTECTGCVLNLTLDGDDSVTSGMTEDIKAEEFIILKPGFEGASGSNVDLHLVPCTDQVQNTVAKKQ